jgi:hypothetical protein
MFSGLFGRKSPRTAILMMQKDEQLLLRPWFEYHAAILGAENLYIFDNGSRAPTVPGLLDTLEEAGANIIREHDDHASFCNKGIVFLKHMKHLKRRGYRLFIPMDCDEFLAVKCPGGPIIDHREIHRELARSRGTTVLQTTHCYLNHPAKPTWFRKSPFNKVLGTFEGIEWLGEGFHRVRAPMEPSNFTYLHLHYRPYEDFRARAAAKIVAHGHSLDPHDLETFAGSSENGRHSATEYLMDEDAYHAMLEAQGYEDFSGLAQWFVDNLGKHPFE